MAFPIGLIRVPLLGLTWNPRHIGMALAKPNSLPQEPTWYSSVGRQLGAPMHWSRVGLVAVIGAVAGGRAGAPTTRPSPENEARSASVAAVRSLIDSLAGSPDFSNAHWGILIVDPERGDTLFSRNAGKLFMPASNMKILTSATVFDRFVTAYRYSTSFAARGSLHDGTLAGDLVVVGRGDPSVSDHMQTDAMLPLRAAAESLAAHGVRRISGRLVAGGEAVSGGGFRFWGADGGF